jgi:glycosyltransferase involved in cell wall biosynthesis
MDLGFRFRDFPAPDPAGVNGLRSRFGGKQVVLAVGRFIPTKRYGLIVDAAEKVLRQRRDLVFLLLGDGPLLANEKQRAERKGLSRLHFLGHVSRIEDYYGAADLLVHPSSSEASCNTLKEALFYQVPFLACRGVGDLETYCLRQDYFLPRDLSASGLAARICSALERPLAERRPTPVDRQRMLSRFDIENQVGFLRGFLEDRAPTGR